MNNKIVLKVGGKAYSGWTEVHVSQSLDQLTGTFSFSITNPYPDIPSGWSIKLGEYCTVEIDDQVVISGYIDDMPIEYDATNHSIQISGRDITGDLVDCSYPGEKVQWDNQSISSIIQELCDPFNIPIAVDDNATEEANISSIFAIYADPTYDSYFPTTSDVKKYKYKPKAHKFNANTSKIKKHVTNPGVSVGELITGLCKTKAILPISYGDGYLTLTRAGNSKCFDTISLGNNIKSGHLTQSNKERYGIYTVMSQTTGDAFYDITSYIQSTSNPNPYVGPSSMSNYGVIDTTITRYRPLIILEEGLNAQECKERAEWEARRRAGKSRSIEYVVQGWTQSNGQIWELNSLVNVVDKIFGINETLLISKVDFMVNDKEGTTTRLTVIHPSAYELIEEKIKDISSKDDPVSSIYDSDHINEGVYIDSSQIE